jgi:hypothetical protein
MCASVIAGVDAPLVFEAPEHVFNFMLLPIKFSIVADRYFAIRSTRDAGGDAALIESFAEPVGIVSSVAEQFFCFWQRAQYQCRAFVVAHLPFAQHENDRPPLAITDGM